MLRRHKIAVTRTERGEYAPQGGAADAWLPGCVGLVSVIFGEHLTGDGSCEKRWTGEAVDGNMNWLLIKGRMDAGISHSFAQGGL